MAVKNVRPVIIVIRDGWGKNPFPKWNRANAIYLARHPVADRLMADYPSTLIHTSGFDVGLPEGTMGNSEVGHQNIGAGRIVDQESVRITKQIRDGEFYSNGELNTAVEAATAKKGAVHLFGIVSDAGVHGLLEHLYGCLQLCKRKGAFPVFLHAFTDGRDTPPNSGLEYLRQIEAKMAEIGVGEGGEHQRSLLGDGPGQSVGQESRRHTARLRQWGRGEVSNQRRRQSKTYYDHPTENEHVAGMSSSRLRSLCGDGRTPRVVTDGDSVIFYNYRGDRPRELTKAFTTAGLHRICDRGQEAGSCYFRHDDGVRGRTLAVHVAYPKPPKMKHILGEYLSATGFANNFAVPRRRNTRTSRSSSTIIAMSRFRGKTGTIIPSR
jgi:2,3-bisphosphoglycerate-independent phosphoglycerate mutase